MKSRFLIFNKPYGVLTRFTDDFGRPNLSNFIEVPQVYPVGRLDLDSEGLLFLTDEKRLVRPLTQPGGKAKTYLVCVERLPDEQALESLRKGVKLKDGSTKPAEVKMVEKPSWLWSREPPIRFRKTVPTAWLELTIREGRNRQVRRMTAAVGHPTLRLVRKSFGPLQLGDLKAGEWREASDLEVQALLDMVQSSKPGHGRRSNRRRKKKR